MNDTRLTAKQLMQEIDALGSPGRAVLATRYFKCGAGEYGEGDRFVGVSMPILRATSKKYRVLPISELKMLLASPIHEHRMCAVVIMADTYKKVADAQQLELYNLYISGLENNQINNWDLVDVSAPHIVGAYCLKTSADPLYKMVKSDNLWVKRTSILSTFAYLRAGDADHTVKIAELLLDDSHDLIHKAVGWLLREAGKLVNEKVLTDFLDKHAHEMPRTMLRYSLEKLTPEKRKHYMRLT